MKMKQREILNALPLDFRRDCQTQEEYLDKKIEEIKAAIREYLKNTGLRGYMLGLSGGIDSFAAAALVADAVKEISGVLYLLLLPNGEQADMADSIQCRDALLARFDNIEAATVSIENAYAGVLADISSCPFYDPENRYALGNTQARLRMVEQYALAKNLLVIGTDHATENVTGYFTKYGDGGSDFNPLDGLIKPDIYAIAARYGAPECVMKKAPAAGLGISSSDEEELGIRYEELALYLQGNLIDKEKMQRIVSLYERAEHKRHMPASPMNTWWKGKAEDTTHVVVDMIHAFVDGSMACQGAEEAVAYTCGYMDAHPEMRVLYVGDCHPAEHCSFKENGGEWPAHAVQGTEDSTWPKAFYQIRKTINTPLVRYNVFCKGTDPMREEYSGFNAQNEFYGALKYNLTRRVVVSGIATEYCVKNTVIDLLKNGFEVILLEKGLAYIDRDAHEKTLLELKEMGAKLI